MKKKGGRPLGALPRGKVLVGGDEAGPRITRLDRPPPISRLRYTISFASASREMVLAVVDKSLFSSRRLVRSPLQAVRHGLAGGLFMFGAWVGGCDVESRPGGHGRDPAGSADLTAGLDTLETPDTLVGGARLFEARCSACHGVVAGGTEVGPALLHTVYAPSHHSDFSFHRAVEFGVRAHHWRFGDMEPVEGVSREEVGAIVRYVRWLQRSAGIE